jgi:hypothetical protein
MTTHQIQKENSSFVINSAPKDTIHILLAQQMSIDHIYIQIYRQRLLLIEITVLCKTYYYHQMCENLNQKV